MKDPALRAALFRFVDVRPACASPEDVTRHLHEFLADARVQDRAPRDRPSPAARSRRSPIAAIAGVGVKRMAQRSSSARTRKDALPDDHQAVAAAASRRPSTCSARPPCPRSRPTATCSAARRRCARSPPPPPSPARSTCPSRSPRSRRCCGPTAPERGIEGARPRLEHLLRVAKRGRRAPARRHGVLRHARGDHRAHARPALRSPSSPTARAPASSCRPTSSSRPSTWTSCSTGPPARRASTRSRSAWSRAPTGTTRSSRPPRTAGRRRCSPTAASATATSRRSPSA